MSDGKPAELSDPQRQGIVLRLQPDGTYQPQRGEVPCCRCKQIVCDLYGTHDAPLCTKCMGEIVADWCADYVRSMRKNLGLDP